MTTTATKAINLGYALASAEDDFSDSVHAVYDASQDRIDDDLFEIEALARMTLDFARNATTILNRMEFAKADDGKWSFLELLTEQVGEQLQHGGGSVLEAQVRKMESKL